MKKSKQSVLWEISGSDIHDSYFFGTMHVNAELAFVHVQKARRAIEKSDAFATEIDLNIDTAALDPSDIMLKKGDTLASFYTPHHWARMRKIVKKKMGVDINLFSSLLPIIVINQLSEMMLESKTGVPLDKALSLYAHKEGKSMLGLEKLTEQTKTLKKIPLKYQLRSFSRFCKSISTHEKNLKKLANAYQEEDILKLYTLAKKSLNGLKSLMLYDRNAIMVDRFLKIARDQSIFAAVGAAHLAGSKGVLNILKHSGYQIKPIHQFIEA